ncbi:hypothetical protein WR25_12670 [Diploscapter pachys]|uniref:Uncharacterized protein n=1 Tax=Diploscapter pachys TaxID=2018661 RepID=A0A2A2KEZ2_9BILA|nr:hypothetical protein WR25_12670 [Diploscapter pachys]
MQCGEQLQPGHDRHADIADHDAGIVGAQRVEGGRRGGEAVDGEAGQRQPLRGCGAQIVVIVDQRDAGRDIAHARRIAMAKAAPCVLGTSRSDPPRSCMISCAIVSPSPSPVGRLVAKGVNSRSAMSGAMPGPVSAIVSTTHSP